MPRQGAAGCGARNILLAVASARQDGPDGAQSAFDHAVRREREAIRTHERSARLQDQVASLFERQAAGDTTRRDLLLRQAERARTRANAARARAASARQRLAAEGVESSE